MSDRGLEEPKARTSPGRLRLDYLDGLRGLAALYVVIYHATAGYREAHLPAKLITGLKFLTYGHFSVAVFIVLSGYCLMLPVARSANRELSGGLAGYIKRRARRILPPYYAAVAFALILIALVPALSQPTGTIWDGTTPAFTPGALLSHLLVVHNLKNDWIFRINGPLWSVATEWQIYFFLPLLMIPIWKRFGIVPMVLVSFAIGLFPHFALHGLLEKAVPWYLGLFALGAGAAVINFSPESGMQGLRERAPWATISGFLWIVSVVAGFGLARWWWKNLWFADIVVGLATATLLIYCTQHLIAGEGEERPSILKVLESKFAVTLGRFSYSLYLTHMPVLALTFIAMRSLPLGNTTRFLAAQLTMLPLSILVAYLFYQLVERHFVSAPKSKAVAA